MNELADYTGVLEEGERREEEETGKELSRVPALLTLYQIHTLAPLVPEQWAGDHHNEIKRGSESCS